MVVNESLVLPPRYKIILCFLLMCLTQTCKYFYTLQIIICHSCRLKSRLRGRREVEEAVKFHPKMLCYSGQPKTEHRCTLRAGSHWALIIQPGKQAPSCPIFQIKCRKDASRASGLWCLVVMSSFRPQKVCRCPRAGDSPWAAVF